MKPRTMTVVLEVETDAPSVEVKRALKALTLTGAYQLAVRQVVVAVVDATKKKGGPR